MKLYAVRHGQAEHNIAFRFNDDPASKSDLTNKGRAQAEEVAKQLADTKLDIIFTSELPRAIQTAAIINRPHGVKQITDSRLNEIKTGFHGRSVGLWLSMRLLSPNNHDKKHGDGESLNEAKARIEKFIGYLKSKDYDNVLVVAHQHTLQALNSVIAGHDYARALRRRVGHAELLEFQL